ALQHARASVAALPGPRGSESPRQALARASLAEALLDVGQAKAALEQARAAVAAGDRLLPQGNWQRMPLLLALPRAELATGHAARADSLLASAWPLHASSLPENDPRRLEVQVVLLRALLAQGKQVEAASLRSRLQPRLESLPAAYLVRFRKQLAAG